MHNENIALFNALLEYLPQLLQSRSFLPSNLLAQVDKLILKIGKLYIQLAKLKPIKFVTIKGSLDVVSFYYTLLVGYDPKSVNEVSMFERFLVQGMILIKSLVKHPELNLINNDNEAQIRLEFKKRLKEELFTLEFNQELLKVLITKFLTLSGEDFESWENEPESFFQEEEADHWEYNLRACSEKLVADLFSQNKTDLAPIIINMLMSVSEPNVELSFILLKDAVYCVLGVVAHDMYDFLDFDDWFSKKLLPESTFTYPNSQIIKRRISLIIGSWVSVKSDTQFRPNLYRVLTTFLSDPQNDVCVRLTAIEALRLCCDDWGFNVEGFLPFFDVILNASLTLLEDLEEVESKIKILNCLSVLVEILGVHILPFTVQIAQILPSLWSQSGDQHMFRSSIIVILRSLVKAMKENSFNLHEFVIPLIQSSVDTTQPGHIYLIDDGLDLWLSTVQNSLEFSQSLFSLMPFLTNLLENATDNLKTVLKIIEAYILLAPIPILQSHSIHLFNSFSTLLQNLKPAVIRPIIHCIDMILQSSFQSNSFASLLPVLSVHTNFLKELVKVLLKGSEAGFIVALEFGILGRVLMYDVGVFGVLEEFGKEGGVEGLGIAVLDSWFDKFDHMTHARERKLSTIAIGGLLTIKDTAMIEPKIEQILIIFSSIVAEVNDLDIDNNAQVYWRESRGCGDDNDMVSGDDDDTSCHSKRVKNLQNFDPVYQVKIKEFVKARVLEFGANFDLRRGAQGEFERMIMNGQFANAFVNLKSL